MAYNRKPNYHFSDKNQTGIDKIPLGRMIIVEDYDGEVKTFLKKSNTGIDSSTTIDSFVKSQDINHSELVEYQKIQGAIGNINSPLLDLPLNNSLAMKQGVGSVTFSRDTKATYIDRYGVLQSADIDEPRFEKDGLLIEGSSTNLLTYSEEFDNDDWSKTQCTITENDTIAPDGTNTADKLAPSSDDDDYALIGQRYSTDVKKDDTYSVSVFVKKGNADKITLNAYFKDETGYNFSFTFSTETASSSNMKVQKIANGWYRLSYKVVATEDNDDAYVAARVWGIGRDVDGTTDDYNYVWGFQLEKLPFATSYIPTADSAVTRDGDVCKVDAKDNIPLLDNVAFSMAFNTFCVNTDDYHNYTRVFEVAGTEARITSSSSGSLYGQVGGSGTVYGFGDIPRVSMQTAILISTNSSVDGAKNGVLFNDTETASNIVPSGLPIFLGTNEGGTSQLFGHIKNFKIYDKALSPIEIQLLSGGN